MATFSPQLTQQRTRLPFSFERALPSLIGRITGYRLNEDGIIGNEGQYNFEQYFDEPEEIKHPRYGQNMYVIPGEGFIIEDISLQASVQQLTDVMREAWYRHASTPGLNEEDIELRCLADEAVRVTIEYRLNAMRIHLLWRAIIPILPSVFGIEPKLQELVRILRLREVEGGNGVPILLEDYLLNNSEYGEILKRALFRDAIELLKRGVNSDELQQLKVLADPHLEKLGYSLRVASYIRRELSLRLGGNENSNITYEPILRDTLLLHELTLKLERCCGASLPGLKEEGILTKAYQFSGVGALLGRVENDVRIETSLAFTSRLYQEYSNSGEYLHNEQLLSSLACQLGYAFKHHQYTKLKASLNPSNIESINYFSESESPLKCDPKYKKKGFTMLATSFFCIHHELISPSSRAGYNGTFSYHQALRRLNHNSVKKHIKSTMEGSTYAEVISQIYNSGVPPPLVAQLKENEIEARTLFYTRVIHQLLIHYVNLREDMNSLAALMVSNSSSDRQTQSYITSTIIEYLHGMYSGLKNEEDFIAALDLWLNRGILNLYLDSQYIEGFLATISSLYITPVE